MGGCAWQEQGGGDRAWEHTVPSSSRSSVLAPWEGRCTRQPRCPKGTQRASPWLACRSQWRPRCSPCRRARPTSASGRGWTRGPAGAARRRSRARRRAPGRRSAPAWGGGGGGVVGGGRSLCRERWAAGKGRPGPGRAGPGKGRAGPGRPGKGSGGVLAGRSSHQQRCPAHLQVVVVVKLVGLCARIRQESLWGGRAGGSGRHSGTGAERRGWHQSRSSRLPPSPQFAVVGEPLHKDPP